MNHDAVIVIGLGGWAVTALAGTPALSPVQTDVFSDANALSNAFADVDGDADVDLSVSFADGAVRLYLNEAGVWIESGERSGLPLSGPAVRGLSWGDFDADGDPDLYAGVSPEAGERAQSCLSQRRAWRLHGSG